MGGIAVWEEFLPNEMATQALGSTLAPFLQSPLILYLSGELGAGKTTLVRAMLRQLGITGAIKSPTFSLIEPYSCPRGSVYHCDLYRLDDPEEVLGIGLRDYCDANSILIIEWPEKGGDLLPSADLVIKLTLANPGRTCHIKAKTSRGKKLLANLSKVS